jgi:hypothetical protein
MVHLYPRQKKRFLTINGIFDDFSNIPHSEIIWQETFGGSNVVWDVVSAPGTVGGNALWIKGTIANGLGLNGCGALSFVPNDSHLYYFPLTSPFFFEMKAEFRMRIADDEADAGNLLSHSAGFILDGAVKHTSTTNYQRTGVYFSVANQKAGLGSEEHPYGTRRVDPLHTVDWTGSLDTWYDIRIHWRFDWWEAKQTLTSTPTIQVYVDVYVNNSLLFSTSVDWTEWRINSTSYGASNHLILGRCGPTVVCENDGGASNGNFVEAYFKDILVTQEVRLASFKFTDGIQLGKNDNRLNARILSNVPSQISKGSDVQLWSRNSTSDDWTGHFRGIIRDVNQVRNKIVDIQAEGYGFVLKGEKSENLSFTTQTADTIVASAINSPTKPLFDTTTFFDSPATTYSRDYYHTEKMSIVREMASLEGFILFVDMANAWHFEEFRTNELSVHLKWSENRIYEHDLKSVFVRQPNIIRVIGTGFWAEREITEGSFNDSSRIVRTINRLDLTTQAAVDEALDYYITGFIEPIKVLALKLRANWSLKKGHIITVTIPEIGLYRHEFLISSISSNSKQKMEVSLLEAKPEVVMLLSELNERTDNIETQTYPSDEKVLEDKFHVETMINTLVSMRYEVYKCPTADCGANPVTTYDLYEAGDMVVTNDCIDWIIDLWNGDLPLSPTHIAYGTSSQAPKFADTALISESSRNTITQSSYWDTKSLGAIFQGAFGVFHVSTKWTSVTSLTEIGILNASSGGDLFARAVLETPLTTSNDVIILVYWHVRPEFGVNYITKAGVRALCDYIGPQNVYTSGVSFLDLHHICVVGNESFAVPNPYSDNASEAGAVFNICPRNEGGAYGTMTLTKYPKRSMLKAEYVYTYDYAHRGIVQTDLPIVAIAISAGQDSVGGFPFMIFYRTTQYLSDLDEYDCIWIFWLKFKRGQIEVTT